MLFALVLARGLDAQALHAEERESLVLFEKLGAIEIEAAFVALLVEVHRTHADLGVLKVRRHDDDEVIGAHVAKQAHEAALVEFNQLLGEADGADLGVGQPAINELVARDAGDVLLHQRSAAGEVVEAIG